uniref:Transmembrane protein n=1 Tax=Glossina palpalis gambiensis TaxID=67801 RepID=A0A1B0BU78_9MUSC
MKGMTSCLRGMDSDLENSKNINTRIKLLDGTQDKAFEESDLDGCRENDIETEIDQHQKQQQQKNNQEKRARTLNNDCVLKLYRVSIATAAVAVGCTLTRCFCCCGSCANNVSFFFFVIVVIIIVSFIFPASDKWVALINKDSERAWICVNVVHTTSSVVPAGITSSVYPEILNLFLTSSISCEPSLEFNRIRRTRHKHIVDKHI